MTNNDLRNVALLLKSKVTELHDAIAPANAEVNSWTLNLSDAKLPTIAQVKAVLLAFAAVEKPQLALYDELRAIKSASDVAATLPKDTPFPTTEAADWNTLANKPATFPASPHINQRLFLHFPFPGSLSVGQSAVAVIPSAANGGARLINITALMIDPRTSGAVQWGVMVARPSTGGGWQVCTSSPSPIAQEALSQPYGLYYVPTLDGFALPAEWSNGMFLPGDIIKVVIEATCSGAADAVAVLEFYPDFEDFVEEITV